MPERKDLKGELKGTISKRLIGLSSRISSIKFSPDGKQIAVAGGNPGEFGEVQVWDTETGKLKLSKLISWCPFLILSCLDSMKCHPYVLLRFRGSDASGRPDVMR